MKKHWEGRHANVAHAIGRVGAPALVREPIQAASQRSGQGIKRTHARHGPDLRVLDNLRIDAGKRSSQTIAFKTYRKQRKPIALRTAAIPRLWRGERFPEIARQAKDAGGKVYFWDAAGFRAEYRAGQDTGRERSDTRG